MYHLVVHPQGCAALTTVLLQDISSPQKGPPSAGAAPAHISLPRPGGAGRPSVSVLSLRWTRHAGGSCGGASRLAFLARCFPALRLSSQAAELRFRPWPNRVPSQGFSTCSFHSPVHGCVALAPVSPVLHTLTSEHLCGHALLILKSVCRSGGAHRTRVTLC